MVIVLYSLLIKSMVRNISYWLTPGNWENQNLLLCNFMTNVFFSSRNSFTNRRSLLLLKSVSILFLAKVLGSASVYAPCGQAFRNTEFLILLLCHIKLDVKFCWEYKDCPNWDVIQDLAQEKHLIPSAFQTINKTDKKWWNRALHSQLLWAHSLNNYQASCTFKLQNDCILIFH